MKFAKLVVEADFPNEFWARQDRITTEVSTEETMSACFKLKSARQTKDALRIIARVVFRPKLAAPAETMFSTAFDIVKPTLFADDAQPAPKK